MATPAPRRAAALLVGIGAYRHADRIAPLRYAPRDARAMARLFADPDVCGLAPDDICLLPAAGWAQADFPNKPLRLISPFPAGGTSDVMARMIAGGSNASGCPSGRCAPRRSKMTHSAACHFSSSILLRGNILLAWTIAEVRPRCRAS